MVSFRTIPGLGVLLPRVRSLLSWPGALATVSGLGLEEVAFALSHSCCFLWRSSIWSSARCWLSFLALPVRHSCHSAIFFLNCGGTALPLANVSPVDWGVVPAGSDFLILCHSYNRDRLEIRSYITYSERKNFEYLDVRSLISVPKVGKLWLSNSLYSKPLNDFR